MTDAGTCTLEAELRAIREIERLLRQLDQEARARVLEFLRSRPAERRQEESAPEPTDTAALAGREIRTTAVCVLLEHGANGCTPERAHYRAWYRLLVAQGYRVRGKDPLATFLTSVRRSPLVEPSTEQGVYRLELRRLDALRERREALRRQLADTREADRCEESLRTLRRVERELEEAELAGGGQ